MIKLSAFQITILAIFGACAAAGVLIFAIATSSSKTSSVGPITIWGTLDGPTFTSVVENAANTYPALSQVTYVQEKPADYQNNLTQALASGAGPDVFLITQDEAIQDSGETYVFPYTSLSQSQFQSTFAEAADPFMLPTGIVALPVIADPLVLYWNRDLLSDAGYSEPPQYWNQLPDMAAKMTQKDDAGTIKKSAVALGTYQNIDDAKDILSALIMQAGGTLTSFDSTGKLTSTLSDSGITPSEPAALTALRFYTEFSNPSNSDYSWNGSLPDAQQDFAQGNVALYIGYASEEAEIKAENPNLNFAVAPLPQIQNGPRSLDFARVYGFAVARASKSEAGAQTVAETLASTANSSAFETAYNLPSVRRDILAQSASGDLVLFNQEAIISHEWYDPDPSATATIFQSMIEDTVSGAVLIGDAVGRADQQMLQLIASKL
ncbi:MAG TPA: extracellular solute-binding protein [Candidatus Paceibacterota bacterium]|nr:extracellular solute-binding protein [Candidatus Paceibacterota bacterium]